MVYFLVFAALCVGAWVRPGRLSVGGQWGVIAALSAFMGLRVETGPDYWAYAERHLNLSYLIASAGGGLEGEWGYLYLSRLADQVGVGFPAVIFVAGFLGALALVRLAAALPCSMYLLVAGFPLLVIQLGMSGLRQSLALSWVILGVASWLKTGRAMMLLVLIGVASTFHASALLLLLPALMLILRIDGRFVISGAIVAIVVYGLTSARIETYSDRYVEKIYGDNDAGGAYFRLALVSLPVIYDFLIGSSKLQSARTGLRGKLGFFAVCLFLLGAVSTVALHRMIFYFVPLNLVYWGMLFARGGWIAQQSRQLCLASTAVYLIGWMGLSRHAQMAYLPYRNILLGG